MSHAVMGIHCVDEIRRILETLGVDPQKCSCTGIDVRLRVKEIMQVTIYAHGQKETVRAIGDMIVRMADAADEPVSARQLYVCEKCQVIGYHEDANGGRRCATCGSEYVRKFKGSS